MLFLVVDDDELSRELFAMLLRAERHEVEVAASGEAALARLGEEGRPSPEVILSDMQMPGLSGAALARALRSTSGPTMSLFAMSASQPTGLALTGFDGFLLKPFSIEDLDALVLRTQRQTDISESVSDPEMNASNPETGLPILNEETYEKMATMMGGAQLAELYGMCLADARRRLAQMIELAQAGDDAGYRKAAHTVKGGSGMIGATELYKLAEVAERDGLAVRPDARLTAGSGELVGTNGVKPLLGRFSSACDRLERILTERKQN